MLTKRYMVSTSNIPSIFEKIVQGVAPPKFNIEHLKTIGFGASNDRAMVPLLKDLGFLQGDGTPTPRYHKYRDGSQSRKVMAEALRDAYEDLFHISEKLTAGDRSAIEGLFKSRHNSTDLTAKRQAATFLALLNLADLDSTSPSPSVDLPRETSQAEPEEAEFIEPRRNERVPLSTELHYTIQVHLPATKDIEVFNAIFRSLRENLLA